MLGVLIHVIGDAINNVGVIIAALIIWRAKGHARYYADPAVGVFIAIMILLTRQDLLTQLIAMTLAIVDTRQVFIGTVLCGGGVSEVYLVRLL